MIGKNLNEQKRAIQDELRNFLKYRNAIGLTDVKRALSNAKLEASPAMTENGRFVAKMLNAVGWRRDGWIYTGYDRTQRYIPSVEA